MRHLKKYQKTFLTGPIISTVPSFDISIDSLVVSVVVAVADSDVGGLPKPWQKSV